MLQVSIDCIETLHVVSACLADINHHIASLFVYSDCKTFMCYIFWEAILLK